MLVLCGWMAALLPELGAEEAGAAFRVLLVPLRLGEVLPSVTRADAEEVVLAWEDQTDRVRFETVTGNAARVVVTRNGDTLLDHHK